MYSNGTIINHTVLCIVNLLRGQILSVPTKRKNKKTMVTLYGDKYVN